MIFRQTNISTDWRSQKGNDADTYARVMGLDKSEIKFFFCFSFKVLVGLLLDYTGVSFSSSFLCFLTVDHPSRDVDGPFVGQEPSGIDTLIQTETKTNGAL